MKVEQDGKTLYHIQNNDMGSDGYPLDAYCWCDHEPTEEDMRKIWDLQYGNGYGDNKNALDTWLTTSEVHCVWAEEL